MKEIRVLEFEKIILNALPKQYKYIARDRYEGLYVYEYKPVKNCLSGDWLGNGTIGCLNVYSYGFDFIKWEDEEPALIADLLNS